ncbi:MAG: MMPL family transporter [Cyclobacteriaceae bacterium]
MWHHLAIFILRYRLYLIIIIGIITAFMVSQFKYLEMSYDLASVVPKDDEEMQGLIKFKETFGEDGNVIALGIQDSAVYAPTNFQRFKYLSDELARLDGVNGVLGLPNLRKLTPNRAKKTFELTPVFPDMIDDQHQLDSLLYLTNQLRFYTGQLINERNGATLLLVTIDKQVLNSKARDKLVADIILAGEQFEEATEIDVHFAGMPYLRSHNMVKIKAELNEFLVYSVLITGLILFFFFRSIKAVAFPLIIIGVVVMWTVGTIALLGYQITILTGLIPSIIVVIGIPNSVYMLNMYHQEYAKHGDQVRALRRIIRKIGIVTLITNFTTAVGFGVLVFTNINILMEFGIVASINIMATFLVSIILIPSLYSYVKPPKGRHLKHLEFSMLQGFLNFLDRIIHEHRKAIFFLTFIVVIIAGYGVSRIEAISYVSDDIPKKSQLKKDLEFFEKNFSGIMPLEVVVDTGNKKGVQNLKNLRKIDEMEKFLDSLEYISQPVSVVSFVKAARQSFYNDKPEFYTIPNKRDLGFIIRYLGDQDDPNGFSKNFMDSTGQRVRVSLKVADVGSKKMDSLVQQVIRPRLDEMTKGTKLKAELTGTTLLFIKGNKFLINNLITSMLVAFLVIAVIMALLFRNGKMILISLVPNVIPLLITGGIMGYFGIPLKPSTALIFSIAFGISVDDSIHLLAKYRQELFANNFQVSIAVSKSVRETGASMIYTSIILFCGFVIFAASDFGGTVALGKLTSITLLFAMLTNVIVLPALLLQFDSGKRDVTKHPLIESYPEFADTDENGNGSSTNKKD